VREIDTNGPALGPVVVVVIVAGSVAIFTLISIIIILPSLRLLGWIGTEKELPQTTIEEVEEPRVRDSMPEWIGMRAATERYSMKPELVSIRVDTETKR
jgi:hypothetical protein